MALIRSCGRSLFFFGGGGRVVGKADKARLRHRFPNVEHQQTVPHSRSLPQPTTLQLQNFTVMAPVGQADQQAIEGKLANC